MQIAGNKADLIILDGPWAPDRLWMATWGPSNSDLVLGNFFSLCVTNSSVCKDLLGHEGQLPTLVMNGKLCETIFFIVVLFLIINLNFSLLLLLLLFLFLFS